MFFRHRNPVSMPVKQLPAQHSVREPADFTLKQFLLTEHENLTTERNRLLNERRFIDQQIAEHDRALDAAAAALSSFEMADRIQDAFTEAAASWSLDVDAPPSAAYNDASTTTTEKEIDNGM